MHVYDFIERNKYIDLNSKGKHDYFDSYVINPIDDIDFNYVDSETINLVNQMENNYRKLEENITNYLLECIMEAYPNKIKVTLPYYLGGNTLKAKINVEIEKEK